MLNAQEKGFYDYWEAHREKKRKWTSQLFDSLPIGLLFALPMILFFLMEGARNKAMIGKTDLVLICTGTFFIALFYSIFRGRFRWERNEEKYQALRRKLERDASPESPEAG
ncbi:hypothetical protein [Compostibacter hankyongensis]|uniref:Uncharacterized protein n=1 Tax=Compostibacter hankyongensis TaxID=1007089 RepID=A0ABP8FVR4_9BACT